MPSFLNRNKNKLPKKQRVPVFKTIKQISYFYKNYKKLFIVSVILTLISALTSNAGVILNGFLYCKFIIPSTILKNLIDTGASGVDYTLFGLVSFLWFAGGLIFMYLISSFFNWLENLIFLKISENGSYYMRNEIFNKLSRLPIKYFDSTPSGDILSRSISDIENIRDSLSQNIGTIFNYVFLISSMIILMFLINPVLALFAIVLLPLFTFINMMIFKRVQPFFGKQQKQIGILNGFIEEHISGLKIVSLFKMKQKKSEEFREINKKLTHDSIVANASANMMMPLMIFMSNISFVVLAALAGVFMFTGGKDNQGWLSPSWGVIIFEPPKWVYDQSLPPDAIDLLKKTTLLITFSLCVRTLNATIGNLIQSFVQIFLAIECSNRVLEIFNQTEEKDDAEAIELKNIKGLVEAQNMNFGYEKEKPILKNINFTAKPGHTLALVGPTGAGKTTIVNLITKFYDIDQGDLKIDGLSIKKIKRESLRKNISMVLQDTYLFSASIYENIRYAKLNASKNEIIEAAKQSRAHHFIELLPQGYDTILEDNGSNLSQGQRQLLSITRAFLANAKIIILDEATSSIDTKTEIEIQEAMNKLMKDRTAFVIAHRLSTIKNANEILVIKNGEIVERGTHDGLISQNGFYANLYNSQFKGIQI